MTLTVWYVVVNGLKRLLSVVGDGFGERGCHVGAAPEDVGETSGTGTD